MNDELFCCHGDCGQGRRNCPLITRCGGESIDTEAVDGLTPLEIALIAIAAGFTFWFAWPWIF